jgi:uncharacterized membrane protein
MKWFSSIFPTSYTCYRSLLIIRYIAGVGSGVGRCRKLLSYTVKQMKKNVF